MMAEETEEEVKEEDDNWLSAPGKVIEGNPKKFFMDYIYDNEIIEVFVKVGNECEVIGEWETGAIAVVSGQYKQIMVVPIGGKNRTGNLYPVIEAERVRYYGKGKILKGKMRKIGK